jgi:hypothetical protein
MRVSPPPRPRQQAATRPTTPATPPRGRPPPSRRARLTEALRGFLELLDGPTTLLPPGRVREACVIEAVLMKWLAGQRRE